MATMGVTDEFDVADAPVRPVASAGSSARRRGDRPGEWVAIAVTIVGIGILTAPVTLPRASAEVPGWGGLGRIAWITVEGDVDAVELGQQIVDMSVARDADGRILSTVLMLVREEAPGAGDGLAPEAGTAVMNATTGEIVGVLDHGVFADLEEAAPRSDWVCEPEANQLECTALADPEITVVVDWMGP